MISMDKIDSLHCRIVSGCDMLLQEIEDYGRSKKSFSLDEAMKMSDIVKDCSDALKNISKFLYYSK